MAVSSKDRVITRKECNRRKSAHTSREGLCGSFLTQHLDCIHAYDIETVTRRCGELDLPAITEQARHFMSLYDKELEFKPTGNKFHDAAILTDIIREKVKEMDIELVEVNDGETCENELVAYKVNDGLDTSNLYFLPIRIVQCVDDQLKEILLDFFAFLYYFSLFRLPYDSYEMCQVLCLDYEETEPKYDEDRLEGISPEYKKFTDRYVNGDIKELFDEIFKRRKDQAGQQWVLVEKVREGMNEYSGSAYYELPNGESRHVSELFEVIEEGIDLNTEDSLGNYDLVPIRYELGDEDFCEEEGCSDEMLCLDSLFTFCYGYSKEDDPSLENVLAVYNQDFSSMGYPVLVEVERLSRCTDKLEPSDFPARWYEWYRKVITFIYE